MRSLDYQSNIFPMQFHVRLACSISYSLDCNILVSNWSLHRSSRFCVEPKYQALGVNVLFGALVFVVAGSLAGQWFGVMQKLGLVENFWLGHQGYEYVELGRLWQILLLTGLVLWLFLMIRALIPALKRKDENRHLLTLFVIASLAIAFFYAAGLMYGRQTHMAIAEYWRWWVVHLWVEGFFEVFATVVASFLFCRIRPH